MPVHSPSRSLRTHARRGCLLAGSVSVRSRGRNDPDRAPAARQDSLSPASRRTPAGGRPGKAEATHVSDPIRRHCPNSPPGEDRYFEAEYLKHFKPLIINELPFRPLEFNSGHPACSPPRQQKHGQTWADEEKGRRMSRQPLASQSRIAYDAFLISATLVGSSVTRGSTGPSEAPLPDGADMGGNGQSHPQAVTRDPSAPHHQTQSVRSDKLARQQNVAREHRRRSMLMTSAETLPPPPVPPGKITERSNTRWIRI